MKGYKLGYALSLVIIRYIKLNSLYPFPRFSKYFFLWSLPIFPFSLFSKPNIYVTLSFFISLSQSGFPLFIQPKLESFLVLNTYLPLPLSISPFTSFFFKFYFLGAWDEARGDPPAERLRPALRGAVPGQALRYHQAGEILQVRTAWSRCRSQRSQRDQYGCLERLHPFNYIWVIFTVPP